MTPSPTPSLTVEEEALHAHLGALQSRLDEADADEFTTYRTTALRELVATITAAITAERSRVAELEARVIEAQGERDAWHRQSRLDGSAAMTAKARLAQATAALEPFALSLDPETADIRYFWQVLICPPGDNDDCDWRPKFEAARTALAEIKGAE